MSMTTLLSLMAGYGLGMVVGWALHSYKVMRDHDRKIEREAEQIVRRHFPGAVLNHKRRRTDAV